MSLNRWATKRDQNERPIVAALRKAGAKVMLLDKFDLLVLYRGRVFMLDAKMPTGRATEAQDAMTEEGWPLRYVRDEVEALEAIGVSPRQRKAR